MAAKKPDSKRHGKSSHGGRRAGSGRKPNPANKIRDEVVAQRQDTVAEAEGALVDFLPRSIRNMILLANGGYQRIEEEWAPADNILHLIRGGDPDGVPPPEPFDPADPPMVLVKKKVSVAEPDRGANQYLIDRVLGRPTQRVENDLKDLSNVELLARITGALGGSGETGTDAGK